MNTIEYLRQLRVGEFTLFDSTVTLVAVYFLSPVLTKIGTFFGIYVSRKSWLLLTLPLGILVHKLVGINTPMTRYFFDPNGHYLLKSIIVSLTCFGIKNITMNGYKKLKKK